MVICVLPLCNKPPKDAICSRRQPGLRAIKANPAVKYAAFGDAMLAVPIAPKKAAGPTLCYAVNEKITPVAPKVPVM